MREIFTVIYALIFRLLFPLNRIEKNVGAEVICNFCKTRNKQPLQVN